MRLLTLVAVLSLVAAQAFAQLTVTSSSPADGAVGVPQSTIISVTFSSPIDTTAFFGSEYGVISNIDSIDAMWYSTDRRTAYIAVRLAANTVYFVVVFWAPGDGGAKMATPYGITFTTGTTFPVSAYQVSGTVSAGTSGISPAHALVALSYTSLEDGEPTLAYGTIADGAGAFTLSYVQPGTYYPVSVKDVDQNGEIDPSKGDPMAEGSPIVVTNAGVSGVNLVFEAFGPISFHEALSKANAIPTSSIPADRVLRLVHSWDTDTTGLSPGWSFYYTSPGTGRYYRAEVGSFEIRAEEQDMWSATWYKDRRPITSPETAAPAESVLARTENGGGRNWRWTANTGGLSFKIELFLGDPRMSQFTGMPFDTSKNYWGAEYEYGIYPRPDSFANMKSKKFLADFTTGNIVSFTSVNRENIQATTPGGFALDQNYPNPFNPTTRIRYTIARVVAPSGSEGPAARVRLAIYDLLGREVAVLVNETKEPGSYTVSWNAQGMASGVYYYKLQAGTTVEMKKMVLLK